MKTTRHSLMAKGIMVLLSLLVLIFALTYTWFTPPDTPATASGISATVENSGDFEYAIGFKTSQTFGEYKITRFTNESTALQFDNLKVYDGTSTDNDGYDVIDGNNQYYHNYNLLYDYTPIDVTGDGATLIRPSMSYGNSQINTTVNDYSIADPNVQYLSFDLFFRSPTSGVSIKLGDGSYAVGACEINGGSINDVGNGALTNSTSANPTYGYNESGYGDFSKDAIVGAIRVAFVPYTYEDTANSIVGVNAENIQSDTYTYLSDQTSLLWMPRSDLMVIPNMNGNDELNTGWTLDTAAENSTYTLNNITFHNNKHTYYRIFEGATDSANHTVTEYADTVTSTVLAQGSREFTSIGTQVKIGDDYYTKVNVRVWVEGTDLESRRAFSGGRFAINFKFKTD